MTDIAVSVVIITKNQRTFLKRSLPVLQAQEGLSGAIEIIVVDSGSTDGAQEWVASQGARLIFLDPRTFNYARAHNAGAAVATSPYIVRLSGDAVPCGEFWLRDLIVPLQSDPNIAAAWGRQILPSHIRNPVERLWEKMARPSSQKTARRYKWPISVLGSNMAYRRDLWKLYPFNERLPQAEDYDWLYHFQRQKKVGVYVPSAAILHGHNETIARALRRSLAQSAIQGVIRAGLVKAVFRGKR